MSSLPWSDCKIAFPTNLTDMNPIWEAFTEVPTQQLPAGWELNTTDGTGARYVVVFRVSVRPTLTDGRRVVELLQRVERLYRKEHGE